VEQTIGALAPAWHNFVGNAGVGKSSKLRVALLTSETLRRLLRLLNQVTADEMHGQAYWLQAFK